jgi:hypothetical protein
MGRGRGGGVGCVCKQSSVISVMLTISAVSCTSSAWYVMSSFVCTSPLTTQMTAKSYILGHFETVSYCPAMHFLLGVVCQVLNCVHHPLTTEWQPEPTSLDLCKQDLTVVTPQMTAGANILRHFETVSYRPVMHLLGLVCDVLICVHLPLTAQMGSGAQILEPFETVSYRPAMHLLGVVWCPHLCAPLPHGTIESGSPHPMTWGTRSDCRAIHPLGVVMMLPFECSPDARYLMPRMICTQSSHP